MTSAVFLFSNTLEHRTRTLRSAPHLERVDKRGEWRSNSLVADLQTNGCFEHGLVVEIALVTGRSSSVHRAAHDVLSKIMRNGRAQRSCRLGGRQIAVGRQVGGIEALRAASTTLVVGWFCVVDGPELIQCQAANGQVVSRLLDSPIVVDDGNAVFGHLDI